MHGLYPYRCNPVNFGAQLVLTECLHPNGECRKETTRQAVPVGVQSRADARRSTGLGTLIDAAASARLLREVQRLYLERTGRAKFSVLGLADWSASTVPR